MFLTMNLLLAGQLELFQTLPSSGSFRAIRHWGRFYLHAEQIQYDS